MNEIKDKINAFQPDGTLTERGYATRMNFIYNRENVKSFPFKLKEWDFYQFHKGRYALQLTIGHLSYIAQGAVTLIDLATGKKWSISTMKPLYIPTLNTNGEQPGFCEYKDRHFHMTYQVTNDKRILKFQGSNKTFKKVEMELLVDHDLNNDKMVIATPFEKSTQFYLNYKENYYGMTGFVRFTGVDAADSMEVDFSGATGVMDWGRGVWPYSHEWFWGNLTGHIDEVPFAFNIGWGFGDLSNATENFYFYNKKAYKLGTLHTEWDDNNLMKVQHFYDDEGKFDVTFAPFYDNYTENKFFIVDTECHQLFGHFSGRFQTEDGMVEFRDILAFVEHAINNW